jgi:hypothetical protein
MSAAEYLRQKAALYRRLATIKTSGGHLADRVLLANAEKLESEAAALEQGNSSSQVNDSQDVPLAPGRRTSRLAVLSSKRTKQSTLFQSWLRHLH